MVPLWHSLQVPKHCRDVEVIALSTTAIADQVSLRELNLGEVEWLLDDVYIPFFAVIRFPTIPCRRWCLRCNRVAAYLYPLTFIVLTCRLRWT